MLYNTEDALKESHAEPAVYDEKDTITCGSNICGGPKSPKFERVYEEENRSSFAVPMSNFTTGGCGCCGPKSPKFKRVYEEEISENDKESHVELAVYAEKDTITYGVCRPESPKFERTLKNYGTWCGWVYDYTKPLKISENEEEISEMKRRSCEEEALPLPPNLEEKKYVKENTDEVSPQVPL